MVRLLQDNGPIPYDALQRHGWLLKGHRDGSSLRAGRAILLRPFCRTFSILAEPARVDRLFRTSSVRSHFKVWFPNSVWEPAPGNSVSGVGAALKGGVSARGRETEF